MAPPRTTTEPMSTTCNAQPVTLVGIQSGRGLCRIRISRQISESVSAQNILVQGIKTGTLHPGTEKFETNLSSEWICVGPFINHPEPVCALPIIVHFRASGGRSNATRHLAIRTTGRVIVPVAARLERLERKQPACPKTARNHVLLLSVLYPLFVSTNKDNKTTKRSEQKHEARKSAVQEAQGTPNHQGTSQTS